MLLGFILGVVATLAVIALTIYVLYKKSGGPAVMLPW